MEYYDGKVCLSRSDLVDGDIMSDAVYRHLQTRGQMKMTRRGGGKGAYALIDASSLPSRFESRARAAYPKMKETGYIGWICSRYATDQAAVAFFNDRAKTGLDLPPEKINEYVVNASALNTCIELYTHAKDCQRLFGRKYSWEQMAAAIEALRGRFGHTLPSSTLRFRKKVAEYKREGYGALISGRFGNQSARKVDYKTERLILSVASLPNKPFNTNVHEMYLAFVCGELDVYDIDTGELYDPDDFTDKNGEPLSLSESTINNILNKPENRLKLAYAQDSRTSFYHEQMPFMHRHGGRFSLSQITMDDVDLTRKLKDTEKRVHAYYAYDVLSGCVLGAAYGREKTEALVVDCFRDMFRTIERNGWGIPAAVEVENHLMTEYKDGFLKAGEVFPFVHFCAPLNSQEKYAEALNGAKKRAVIHKNREGIGRFYGKGKWRTESRKVSDAENDTWRDKNYYTWEELVADDRADNREWNNRLHPNQKRYPGMTRLDVLKANINPSLKPYDKLTLARYIGERAEATVRRNSTVRAAYEEWWLSGPEILERLEPNNYKVTACWLPEEDGTAKDIYLFQGGRFIDKPEKVVTYNRNYAEQTDDDHAAFIEQQKRVSRFEKYLRDNAITRVGKQRRSVEPDEEAEAVYVQPAAQEAYPESTPEDTLARAIEQL